MKLAGRYLLWCVVCLCMLSCSTQKEEEEIRFAIVSDLHAPDLPNGKGQTVISSLGIRLVSLIWKKRMEAVR